MLFRNFFLLFFVCPFYACTHEAFLKESAKPSRLELEKSSPKKKQAQKPDSRHKKHSQQFLENARANQELDFYLRISDLKIPLSVRDIQQLRKISLHEERNLLNRASLLFGVLRAFTQNGVDSILFEQAVLSERDPTDSQNWVYFQSLEDLLKETRISFLDEVENNPFAQHIEIVELARDALKQDPFKESAFSEELKNFLLHECGKWIDIYKSLEGEENPAEQNPLGIFQHSDVEESSTTEAISDNKEQEESSPSTNSQSPEEQETPIPDAERLEKAKELSEKADYFSAVSLLNEVTESSLYYSDAEREIIRISNIAVKKLKTNAAKAFQRQNSAPTMAVRAKYLKEAEGFLLQALEHFPKSQHIDEAKKFLKVVQNTLNVINKN